MPISKLAPAWSTTIAGIIKVCDLMNIPRPGSGHWALVQRGWEMERSPLPPAEADTPVAAVVVQGKKRPKPKPVEQAEKVETETQPKVEVPEDLRNAHRLVKQTHKALTTDTYVHNGFVQTRSGLDHPLSVAVSPEGLERALRILDAIIKAVIEKGGRFERGPERWRLRLFMGKQPVEFRVREAMKRHDRRFTAEEREAPGFMWRDKYDWVGSGMLRFVIERGDYVRERTWEDSKKLKLEEQLGEIIGVLVNVEKEAVEIRAAEAERKKLEAEERRQSEIEWRREREEEENRKRLEEKADAWAKTKRLRSFIRACEAVLRGGNGELPVDGWEMRWLGWAREHANRFDPFKKGYLDSEKRRFRPAANNDDEDDIDIETD